MSEGKNRVKMRGLKMRRKGGGVGGIVQNCIMYVVGQDSAGEGWLGAPLRVRS